MLINMQGKRYGQLKVLKYSGINNLGRAMWMCKCDCGTKKVVAGNSLRSGSTRSCGCLFKKRFRKLDGVKFKHWTFLERVRVDRNQYPVWRIRCDCGRIVTRRVHGILYRGTSSCGCQKYIKRVENTVGKKFGRLTVIQYLGPATIGLRWLCKCVCGKQIEKTSSQLHRNHVTNLSCGNHLPIEIESRIIGKRFGKLVPLKFVGVRKWGGGRHWRKWLCQCDCGKKVETTTFMLTAGYRRSCGCMSLPGNRSCKHGLSRTWKYFKWVSIRQKARAEHIHMQPEWRKSVKAFVEAMSGMPRHAALKMFDPTKGYIPENCYWKPRKPNEKRIPLSNNSSTIAEADVEEDDNWKGTARGQ